MPSLWSHQLDKHMISIAVFKKIIANRNSSLAFLCAHRHESRMRTNTMNRLKKLWTRRKLPRGISGHVRPWIDNYRRLQMSWLMQICPARTPHNTGCVNRWHVSWPRVWEMITRSDGWECGKMKKVAKTSPDIFKRPPTGELGRTRENRNRLLTKHTFHPSIYVNQYK